MEVLENKSLNLTTDDCGWVGKFVNVPSGTDHRKELNYFGTEFCIMDTEIDTFLGKGVGCQASLCSEQVTTTVFLRTRRDGSHSIIINLKSLDKIIEKLVSWLIGALNPLNR